MPQGGRPAERLMASLGLRQSDDTILRSLKRHPGARDEAAMLRVVGIDDWAWQKGCRYGTIMVDLEQREVVDVLPDRSVEATSRWLVGSAFQCRGRQPGSMRSLRRGCSPARAAGQSGGRSLPPAAEPPSDDRAAAEPRSSAHEAALVADESRGQARDRRWMDGSWTAASASGTPTPGLDRPQGRLYGHV